MSGGNLSGVYRARPSADRQPYRLARALMLVMALNGGVGGAFALQAQTVPAGTAQRFTSAAQPLGSALLAWSRQTGIQLFVDDNLVRGKTSPALAGLYTPEQALALLLQGTGLQVRRTADKIITVEKAPATAVGTIVTGALSVEGAVASGSAGPNGSSDPTATEGTHSYTTHAVSIGSKTAIDPRELPQAVSVVTQQRIQDQNLYDLADAAEQITGVHVASMANAGQSIYSRGLLVSQISYDNGASSSLSNPLAGDAWAGTSMPDMAAYDHVELLRGADGLFAGAGEAGGTLNLVRKKPLDHYQFTTDTSLGSWDHGRQQFDITGPLNQAGTLKGRLVAAQDSQHYFYKTAQDHRTVVYGILEADFTPDSTLYLGFNYDNHKSTPFDFGLPRYTTGQSLGLSRDTCFCTSWSQNNSQNRQLFAEFNQKLGGDWALKLNVSHEWLHMDKDYLWTIGAVNPSVGTTYGYRSNEVDHTQETLFDAAFTGSFKIAGHKQEVSAGANLQDLTSPETGVEYNTLAVDALHFNPADYAKSAWTEDGYYRAPNYGQREWGLYASLRSEITSSLHSILGLRYSRYNFHYEDLEYSTSHVLTSTINWDQTQRRVLTPYAGLTYDISRTTSIYASYTSTFQPQYSDVTAQGKPVSPVTGNNYEIGAKSSWLQKRLNGSLAIYQNNRRNQAELIGASTQINGFYCCYAPIAKVRIRGIEAELSGEILPGWQFYAGYTYTQPKYMYGYGSSDGERYNGAEYPRNLLKLWSMYQLSGDEGRWRLGGGVDLRSSTEVSGTATLYDIDGNKTGTAAYNYRSPFTPVVAIRVEYRIDRHWSAAFNVNNLLDRRYYEVLDGSSYGNVYGNPRNFMFTLHGQY